MENSSVIRQRLPTPPIAQCDNLSEEENFDDYLELDVGEEQPGEYYNELPTDKQTEEPRDYEIPSSGELLNEYYSELPDTGEDNFHQGVVETPRILPKLPPKRPPAHGALNRSISAPVPDNTNVQSLALNTMRINEVRSRLRPSVTKIFEPGAPAVTRESGNEDNGDVANQTSVKAMRQRFEATSSSANRTKSENDNIYSPIKSGVRPTMRPSAANRIPVGAGLPRSVSQPSTPVAAVVGVRKNSIDKPPATLPKPPKDAVDSDDSVDVDLNRRPWYVGAAGRVICESRLKANPVEGSFLVRDSTRGDPTQPYTLCVFHDGAIFTLMVRLKVNGKYAIGTEKNGEQEFSTVVAMVTHHRKYPITVVGGEQNRQRCGNVLLTL